MYGFVSGVFLCGLRATRLTEKNAFGFESSNARFCSMNAYTAGLCLPWRMLAPITIASNVGRVLRAVDQRPDLRRVAEPLTSSSRMTPLIFSV